MGILVKRKRPGSIKAKTQSKYVSVYDFHGMTLTPVGVGKTAQWVSDCPFCSKEEHFFIAQETHQYDCKVCGSKGNKYTFLKELHKLSLECTDGTDWESLAKLKSIEVETLERHGVALSVLSSNWIVPMWNVSGSMVNLYVYYEKYNSLKATTTCSQHLYMLDSLKGNPRPLWITEGHWDAMKFDELLTNLGIREQHDILAVTGATMFKEEWVEFLQSRDVRLLFDHDDAGQKGIERIAKLCSEAEIKPDRVVWLDWSLSPEEIQSGFDIRDLILKAKR